MQTKAGGCIVPLVSFLKRTARMCAVLSRALPKRSPCFMERDVL